MSSESGHCAFTKAGPSTSNSTCRSIALVNLGLMSLLIVALMAAAAGFQGVGGNSDLNRYMYKKVMVGLQTTATSHGEGEGDTASTTCSVSGRVLQWRQTMWMQRARCTAIRRKKFKGEQKKDF